MNKIRILDGTTLKMIAILSMLIDHIGAVFFPHTMWFRCIGRIAMPIFAFCVAEGLRYTRDRRKYLMRLGIFALITELPFDLAFFGYLGTQHQNIMLTFFLAVLGLMGYDRILGESEHRTEEKNRRHSFFLTVLAWLPIIAAALTAEKLKTDYAGFGVLLVAIFYVACSYPHWKRVLLGIGYILLLRNVGVYLWTGFSAFPLLMYNGKKGRGLKWLFYWFYPGHLIILWLIKCII